VEYFEVDETLGEYEEMFEENEVEIGDASGGVDRMEPDGLE
jgi:hypothetical protein